MGFKDSQISLAIKSCGLQSCSGQESCVCLQDSVYHLVDFINAHLGENEGRGPCGSSTQSSKVATESREVGPRKELLCDMGYEMNEVCHAIDVCGEESELDVLVDFIYATYGYKKESKVLESNVDVKRPQSSFGMDNSINPCGYKTNDENINVPFDHNWTEMSSESSDDVAMPSDSAHRFGDVMGTHVVQDAGLMSSLHDTSL
ncbi:hypothetical protein GOP47_0018505 [Adiantum capillus-veneris]|uniref:Uncharacterized protein n=1 Tax=Adiantum capillus-veneris TaxID=13818 RepID=A0A9D4UES8_ADICA|nr:hypothetical protein GOP47_0018505 [Adiantum capillus-veneris]